VTRSPHQGRHLVTRCSLSPTPSTVSSRLAACETRRRSARLISPARSALDSHGQPPGPLLTGQPRATSSSTRPAASSRTTTTCVLELPGGPHDLHEALTVETSPASSRPSRSRDAPRYQPIAARARSSTHQPGQQHAALRGRDAALSHPPEVITTGVQPPHGTPISTTRSLFA